MWDSFCLLSSSQFTVMLPALHVHIRNQEKKKKKEKKKEERKTPTKIKSTETLHAGTSL